jgi:hypothetical protein
VVFFDDGDERGVGEADAITDGGSIKGGIVPACDRNHDAELTRP